VKILVAPNAYKGTITARVVSEAISVGISHVIPEAEIVVLPVCDGGDGALDTFLDIVGGFRRSSSVCGPLGNKVIAEWGIINDGKTAFIETARAFGLALVPGHKCDPTKTTSRGVGELILSALDLGIRDFVIAVGGSANNDGGMGLLRALGFRFLDASGNDLPEGGVALKKLASIETSGKDERLKDSEFLILSDSTVPLTGKEGVSIMYSPGKGATPEDALELDEALSKYADVIEEAFGRSMHDSPCGGAGGGVVCATEVFLESSISLGIDAALEALNFNDALEGADLVVTGEGQIDEQTVFNKAPIGVAKRAKESKIPVIALCPLVGEGFEIVYEHGINCVVAIASTDGWTEPGTVVTEEVITTCVIDLFSQLKDSGSLESMHLSRRYQSRRL